MAIDVRKSVDPMTDGSGGYRPPDLDYGLRFQDYGSYGLRQFGGWIREEILADLTGREGARAYREMLDNSATIGAMMFAIQQAMRRVPWRVEPANDSAAAEKEAEFVDSLRNDMSHTWDDFLVEVLSMLGYGYSAHEIVYKRRLGPQPDNAQKPENEKPGSKYNDGRIGWRRLPIRGQDVTLKWFFDVVWLGIRHGTPPLFSLANHPCWVRSATARNSTLASGTLPGNSGALPAGLHDRG